MRMNYRTYPIDYINELHRKGIRGRKKAMAFMSYWHDVEMGEFNSERFYANAWGVSASTAHEWIKEFKNEIDLFVAHWHIKNERHYQNVKKLSEQKSSKSSTHEARNDGNIEKAAEQQPSEVFNIYDDNNNRAHSDKNFCDLFFIYRLNTKFAGKKEEAYKAYKKIANSIDPDQLKRAIMLYLHDPSVEKRYNFKNFIENEVYYSYMPKRIKIKIRGEWKQGVYDDKGQVFSADDGFKGVLTPERLAELFAKGELEFVR